MLDLDKKECGEQLEGSAKNLFYYTAKLTVTSGFVISVPSEVIEDILIFRCGKKVIRESSEQYFPPLLID
ncbi:Acetylglutamate kinase [Dirofilaria immitis]